jgi:hypothetical protein
MIPPTLLPLLLPTAYASCARPVLEAAAQSYIQAQKNGDPSLLPLTPNTSYIENDVALPLPSSVLSTPITIDHTLTLHDTTLCQTFTELNAASNAHPYVIHTRLLMNPTGTRVQKIQSVVSDTGDWLFNASSHLQYARTEDWSPIPEPARDSRATIQRAGDLYLDSWGNGFIKAPYKTPCARIEGGAYTDTRGTGNNTCFMPEFPQPFKITKREYVVDEALGGVVIFNDFPFIDTTRPNGTSSTNLLRVEEGLIRYIHEITICATRNCGR